jgi:hypothetical protein
MTYLNIKSGQQTETVDEFEKEKGQSPKSLGYMLTRWLKNTRLPVCKFINRKDALTIGKISL